MKSKLDFKIRVKQKCREVQERLFQLGFGWRDSGVLYEGDENNKIFFIFFYTEGNYITFGDEGDTEYFHSHENKEITFEELMSEKFAEEIKKIMLIRGINNVK